MTTETETPDAPAEPKPETFVNGFWNFQTVYFITGGKRQSRKVQTERSYPNAAEAVAEVIDVLAKTHKVPDNPELINIRSITPVKEAQPVYQLRPEAVPPIGNADPVLSELKNEMVPEGAYVPGGDEEPQAEFPRAAQIRRFTKGECINFIIENKLDVPTDNTRDRLRELIIEALQKPAE